MLSSLSYRCLVRGEAAEREGRGNGGWRVVATLRKSLTNGINLPQSAPSLQALAFLRRMGYSIGNRWRDSRAGLFQRWALLAYQGSVGRANATYHHWGHGSSVAPVVFARR